MARRNWLPSYIVIHAGDNRPIFADHNTSHVKALFSLAFSGQSSGLVEKINHNDISYNMRYIKRIASVSNQSIFAVNWQLTSICNNKCSYCPAELHEGPDLPPTLGSCIDFAKFVIEHAKSKNKQAWFELTGGEPTIWKGFVELASAIKESGGKILLLTNGKRPLEWWGEHGHLFDGVDISYHVEFSKQEHLHELVKILAEHGVEVHVNVMMLPARFDECLDFAKSLLGMPTTIDLQPIIKQMTDLSQNTPFLDYTEEQMGCIKSQTKILGQQQSHTGRDDMIVYWNDNDEYETSTKKIIDQQSNYWEGWSCHIGVEQVIIDSAGFIKRGWCQDDVLGHVGKPGFKFPKNWIECNRVKCHCAFDMRATKEMFEWPF